MNKRSVFFISDSTGITAQTLGQTVLSQFGHITFEQQVISHVNSMPKAIAAVDLINQASAADQQQAIVFDSIVDNALTEVLAQANCLRFNIFDQYVKPLELALDTQASPSVGLAHGQSDQVHYANRMDAVHFAMANDDGGRIQLYEKADIILTGVSRCGKTPTCLYLALQYGIYAANYPMTEDDLDEMNLPKALRPYRKKLFGLSIRPDRLSLIRHERKADSRYASLRQCEMEVYEVEAIFRRCGIQYIDATDSSIEEIAASIFEKTSLQRLPHP